MALCSGPRRPDTRTMSRSPASPNPDTAADGARPATARGAQPVPGLREWAALLTLVVVWGSAFLLTEIALAGYTPATLVAGRLLIGAGLLLFVVMASGQRLPHWRYPQRRKTLSRRSQAPDLPPALLRIHGNQLRVQPVRPHLPV